MGRGGRGGTHQEWAEAGVVEQIIRDFVVIDSVAAVARQAQLVIACRGENEIIKNTINYHRCSLSLSLSHDQGYRRHHRHHHSHHR